MSQEPYASAKRVFWIVDTGSSHRGDAAAQRLTEAFPTTVMVHTPIHASWLNQVEIYYSIVQRKGLSPNDFTDLTEVETRLASFEQRFNATAAPFNWKFAADDLDDLLTRIDRHERAHQPDTAPIKHAAWLPTNFRSRPPTYSGPANPPGQFRTATTPPARPARRTRRREPGRSGAVGVDRADPSAPVRGLMALARRRSDAILPVSVPQGRQGVWARFSAGKAECLGSLPRRRKAECLGSLLRLIEGRRALARSPAEKAMFRHWLSGEASPYSPRCLSCSGQDSAAFPFPSSGIRTSHPGTWQRSNSSSAPSSTPHSLSNLSLPS